MVISCSVCWRCAYLFGIRWYLGWRYWCPMLLTKHIYTRFWSQGTDVGGNSWSTWHILLVSPRTPSSPGRYIRWGRWGQKWVCGTPSTECQRDLSDTISQSWSWTRWIYWVWPPPRAYVVTIPWMDAHCHWGISPRVMPLADFVGFCRHVGKKSNTLGPAKN